MTPERWQQVKETLAEALERNDPHDRAFFLDATCADDTALRSEVESLLSQPPDEFENCADAGGLAHPGHVAAANIGRRLGAYELVRELGRGGMGTVWLAKRADQQFEKLVAIKLLKRGTDTDEVLRRFEAERQILARLTHPNIAGLLDAGTTPDGLPYFVMEYVPGARVTDYCFAQSLSIPDRLRLFQKICGAVQFAHQNLIVHRDLKPANILITAEGEPKLLDFGIAKLVDPGDAPFEVTALHQQRLTPAYASPEQVRGDPITTLSDVYSLGAILYELLTGQTAHRFARLQPTHTELLRVVVEGTPTRPSLLARDRPTQALLRGDLDNILLKALRKEPRLRYAGAGSFSEDLRRHLDSLPVHARPATPGYRAGKFFSRNKTAVVVAVLVLLMMLAGMVTIAHQARLAARQRARAERRFNDVRKLANSLMLELHNAIKDLPGALAARQLITQRALGYLDSLAQESGQDLSLKSELATAYQKIGLVTFEVAQAIKSHQKAAALNEALVQAKPENSTYRQQLSENYANLSDVTKIAGHSTQSIDYAKRSLALMQALENDKPGDRGIDAAVADRYLSLGTAMLDAGDFKGALANDLLGLAIQQQVVMRKPSDQETRQFAEFYGAISDAYENAGDYGNALDYDLKSLAAVRERFAADPTNVRLQREMWAAFFRFGRESAATGDTTRAMENYLSATRLMESLAAADPHDTGHRRWLAVTYLSLGELCARVGDAAKALERYRQASAISEEIFAADPDRAETRRDLARIYEAMGSLFSEGDQAPRAAEYFAKAESAAVAAANQDPQNASAEIQLARILVEMAAFHRKLAAKPDASPEARKASLQKALELNRRSLGLWQACQKQGLLSSADAGKPVEIAQAIAEGEAGW